MSSLRCYLHLFWHFWCLNVTFSGDGDNNQGSRGVQDEDGRPTDEVDGIFDPPLTSSPRKQTNKTFCEDSASQISQDVSTKIQDDGTNLGGDYNGVIIKYQKYILK